MPKQVRTPFSDAARKELLVVSFERIAAWAQTNASGITNIDFIKLASDARTCAHATGHYRDPVHSASKNTGYMETLARVYAGIVALKTLPEGHPDRCDRTLRIAARRVEQFCEDVDAEGGSFNCAYAKPALVA